ncbi:hypothetical protein J6590_072239 [Homalodisca vitripennis]|nr:hypothetical protein J6590_072239 [Homalodisca vitripennis]
MITLAHWVHLWASWDREQEDDYKPVKFSKDRYQIVYYQVEGANDIIKTSSHLNLCIPLEFDLEESGTRRRHGTFIALSTCSLIQECLDKKGDGRGRKGGVCIPTLSGV